MRATTPGSFRRNETLDHPTVPGVHFRFKEANYNSPPRVNEPTSLNGDYVVILEVVNMNNLAQFVGDHVKKCLKYAFMAIGLCLKYIRIYFPITIFQIENIIIIL